jgi:CubicO group peptidase (beta-lactamase class C family)
MICLFAANASGDEALQRTLRGYLEAHEANGDFMGEVIVADRSRILARVVIGMADIESARAHAPGDVYHVASLTKQFTGAAIAVLEGDGTLQLDDILAEYIPDFPNASEITLRALAQQTAGVPDYNDFDDYGTRLYSTMSLDEIVAWVGDNVGEFVPNGGHSYSNSHYALLAKVIEVASGMRYEDFLRQRILKPAGMRSSGNFGAEIVPRRVEGYDPGPDGTLINAPEPRNSIKLGSGSLYTTGPDLVRWHRALLGEKLLDADGLALYLNSSEHGYAMGNSVWRDQSSGKRYSAHDGKAPGGFAYMRRWLDEGIALIVLSNVNSGQLNRLKADLSAIVNGTVVKAPEPIHFRKLANGEATRVTGRYLFPPDSKIRIATNAGSLVLYWRDTGLAQYLTPLAESDWFYMRSRGERVRFIFDDDGRATALEYDWGGGVQRCERTDSLG